MRGRARTTRLPRLLWQLYPWFLVGLAALALALWWRGGRWEQGELPTSAMLQTLALAAAGLVLHGLAWLFRRSS
jgi:hypothetical protein